MQVLPKGQEAGQGQRVVLGDSAGVLQGFFFREGEYCQVFKNAAGPRPVQCVALGRSQSQRDKVYVAEGPLVKAYDRKGAQFFRFTTPLTSNILHLDVVDTRLFVVTDNSLTVFLETSEQSFYSAPERIQCACVLPLTSSETWVVLLGCQDRCIRMLDGKNVLQEIYVEAMPTTLSYFMLAHDALNRHPTRKELFYGLADGGLGQLFLDGSSHHKGVYLPGSGDKGAVTQIFSAFDMTQSGMNEIAVGRDDGCFEVHDMDPNGDLQLIWETNVHQSINTIGGGFVTSAVHEEYIVQTYPGSIVSFTPGNHSVMQTSEAVAQRPQGGDLSPRSKKARMEAEIAAQEAQIKSTLLQIEDEVQAVQGKRKQLRAKSSAMVAPTRVLPTQHSLRLNASAALYELAIESTAPMFCVAVVSSAKVEFLEAEASVAILTVCAAPKGSAHQSLATYRCHDAMQRVVITMRVSEGQSGVVHAYIVPKNAPKTTSRITCYIQTLSLHQRVRELQPGLPLSTLDISGDFLASDVRQWLVKCLPDLPKYARGQEAKLVYQSAVLKTQLVVTYRDGALQLASDNVCTLAIMRNTIMRHVNEQGVRIRVVNELQRSTVKHFLERLWPEYVSAREQVTSGKLMSALRDVTNQENDSSFLTTKMKGLLEDRGSKPSKRKIDPGELAQQIVLAQKEWVRQEGRAETSSMLARLEHTLADPFVELESVLDMFGLM